MSLFHLQVMFILEEQNKQRIMNAIVTSFTDIQHRPMHCLFIPLIIYVFTYTYTLYKIILINLAKVFKKQNLCLVLLHAARWVLLEPGICQIPRTRPRVLTDCVGQLWVPLLGVTPSQEESCSLPYT